MQNRTPVFAIAALALFSTACGDKKPAETAATAPAPVVAPAAAPAPAPAETPAAAAAPADAAPAPVAPKPGDKADWGPRIAQGKDTLYKHALEGFTGAKGMMPARGGNSKMADDDVKAAVDYMVGLSS